MTRHTYRYGTSEIVGFAAPWRREIYRPFEVHPKEPWNTEIRERCMALAASDLTPHHDNGTSYDPACACCWLNITHTQALHSDRVARKEHR